MFDQHSLAFQQIKARGVIKLTDVLRLRRDHFPTGATTSAAAQALLELNSACPVQDTSWQPFLIEAVQGFIIQNSEPEGYLTATKARWLIGHASNGGRVEHCSCLELLISVLEAARWSPPSLSAFVLQQIEIDIVTGNGPLRTRATTGRGRVGKVAAELIRRVLAAGNRGIDGAITRAEAEVLLDIHDATVTADNCLEWEELFTKAIANVLMTASGYAAPARADVLQSEPWFDPATSPQAFLDTMTARGYRSVLAPYTPRSFEQIALAHLEHHKVEIITAEAIPAVDPAWLAGRLQRTPVLTRTTQGLLSYMRTQDRALHSALRPLLDRAA